MIQRLRVCVAAAGPASCACTETCKYVRWIGACWRGACGTFCSLRRALGAFILELEPADLSEMRRIVACYNTDWALGWASVEANPRTQVSTSNSTLRNHPGTRITQGRNLDGWGLKSTRRNTWISSNGNRKATSSERNDQWSRRGAPFPRPQPRPPRLRAHAGWGISQLALASATLAASAPCPNRLMLFPPSAQTRLPEHTPPSQAHAAACSGAHLLHGLASVTSLSACAEHARCRDCTAPCCLISAASVTCKRQRFSQP